MGDQVPLSRVVVPLDEARWAYLHTAPCDTEHAVARLRQMGLEEIRTERKAPEDEISYIAKDPVYQRSARTAYLSARDRDGGRIWSRGPPRSLTLTFRTPGTWMDSRGGGGSPT